MWMQIRIRLHGLASRASQLFLFLRTVAKSSVSSVSSRNLQSSGACKCISDSVSCIPPELRLAFKMLLTAVLKQKTGGITEMPLIYCPECGHEISNAAVACPNCGRPINAAPVVDRKVVVAPPARREAIPTWAIATVGVLGILLLFLLIAFW